MINVLIADGHLAPKRVRLEVVLGLGGHNHFHEDGDIGEGATEEGADKKLDRIDMVGVRLLVREGGVKLGYVS